MNHELKVTGRILPISESTKRRNPHLYSLGGLDSKRPQSDAVQALVGRVQKPASGPQGVALRITCIAFRKRLLDQHDAVAYSFKPLTDAIAFTLGLDDADKRLQWEYHQILTTGRTGVIVMVQETRAGQL